MEFLITCGFALLFVIGLGIWANRADKKEKEHTAHNAH